MIEQAILMGLAGHRLASLLALEAGPGDVLEKARRAVGVPATGEVKGFLPTLLTCMMCLTIWTTLAMWGLWQFSPEAVAVIAAMGVALAGIRWVSEQS